MSLFSILVNKNDCYKMIVKLTSLYKLQNIKCSVFEWVNNYFFNFGRGFSPVSPILRTPLSRALCFHLVHPVVCPSNANISSPTGRASRLQAVAMMAVASTLTVRASPFICKVQKNPVFFKPGCFLGFIAFFAGFFLFQCAVLDAINSKWMCKGK